jgi:hypothetical protein
MTIRMTRRELTVAGAAAGAALLARPVLAQTLLTRAIPAAANVYRQLAWARPGSSTRIMTRPG